MRHTQKTASRDIKCVKRASLLRIFVMESHADTAKWLGIYLEECGHTVTSAATLEEALPLFPGSKSDVLLADIGMNASSVGWDILERLGQPRTFFTIAMSGYGSNAGLAASSQLAGFRAHLIKPFHAADLDCLLKQAAGECGDRRENGGIWPV